MKKSKILIFSLLIIPWLYTSSQVSKVSFDFSALAGYASYDMADLKELNSISQKSLPFETENVNNFDPGYYYGGSLRIWISTHAVVGLFYQHNSTGSRIGQKDYSGIYTFDQFTDCDIVGLEPEIILFNKKRLSISSSLQAGALFSKITMKEYLKVGEAVTQDDQIFKSFSVAFCPSLKLYVPVIKPVGFIFSAGWMIDTGGKIYQSGNKDAVLIIDSKEAQTRWSGLRLTAGMKINLTNSDKLPNID